MRDIEKQVRFEGASCPLPRPPGQAIVLGHGSGGRLMHGLIEGLFLSGFDNPRLRAGNDAARFEGLAISTDSHVVSPLFFPGGDIGRLAICGTVNDVAMLGADPQVLTAGFVLEEGLEFELLQRIVDSMVAAATESGVQVIAGDTKVVERGKADGLYITTTGIGRIYAERAIGGNQARPGDKVILSGPIGDHGIAVLCARGELGFEASLRSDIAPLNGLTRALLAASNEVHVLRDPTRGGVATSLNEIARASGVGIVLEEERIPVRPAVQSACELLGFDPLYVANEGKLLAFVGARQANLALTAMRSHQYGEQAVIIGDVRSEPVGRVLMRTALGSHRVVEELSGEMLPRIC